MKPPDKPRRWQAIPGELLYSASLGISVILAVLTLLAMLAWVLTLVL